MPFCFILWISPIFSSPLSFHKACYLSSKASTNLKYMKAIKGSLLAALLFIVLLIVPSAMPARLITRQLSLHTNPTTHVRGLGMEEGGRASQGRGSGGKRRRPETLKIAGSSLPDCSHACGSCSPCRLVMVRFFCATVEESETCPMAYKCMCSNKSFPVP